MAKTEIILGEGGGGALTPTFSQLIYEVSNTYSITQSDVVIVSVFKSNGQLEGGNAVYLDKGDSKSASFGGGTLTASLNADGTSLSWTLSTLSGYNASCTGFTQ